jgi:cellulose synthase/poly-beta-1,6-N-acetylglucosamine synthase-like glycosyltransferase
MKKSMYINESIYTSNNYTCKGQQKNRRKKDFFVDTMIMLYIFISLYNEESFKSSNKLVNVFKN